jgi:hypothetical protein
MILESGQHNCYSDWVTGWTIWGSNPGKGRILLYFKNVQFGHEAHPAAYSVGTIFLFPGM